MCWKTLIRMSNVPSQRCRARLEWLPAPKPATLLILWWVFGKDPLHIAPMLPEAVRWLAPDHLAK